MAAPFKTLVQILFFGTGLCLAVDSAAALEAITTPILTSAPNFRDIAGISASNGGTGFVYTTSNNGVMRTGVFYRSDVLSLNATDWETLSSLNIGRDIDLRTDSEIASAQDWVPRGALYTNYNIFSTIALPDRPALTVAPSVMINHMEEGYVNFVIDPNQRAKYYLLLTTLATDFQADLYHCAGGKDRTGWATMILQTIAGVSPATIMNDFLATNTYTATLIASTFAEIMAMVPDANPATLMTMLGVQASYLEAGLDQITATYGSMDAYLMQGLGLSQADIYVLRAKMVSYLTLPGQSGFVGNEAAGATFLNALQESPLSGHYTAFNYYLQAAVDAGTLDGVAAQVGGQVHADAAAFLMRQPQWIDEAIAPYINSRDLDEGQSRVWMAGLGGKLWTDGRPGISSSTERSAGAIVGVTNRVNKQASVTFGIGYNDGDVASAGARVAVDTVLATMGGRYGLSTLDKGPYVTARADVDWVNYNSKRILSDGLGTANGSTNGAIYSGLVGVGDVFLLSPVTLTLQTGFRLTNMTRDGFNESGSDLALAVSGVRKTTSSALVDVDVSLDRQDVGGWALTPAVTLGYERVLGNSQVESTGTLYGYTISQYSAYDSHDLMKAGLGVTLKRDAITIRASSKALVADSAKSTGLSGQLSVGYSF